jgi:hypothetical protein
VIDGGMGFNSPLVHPDSIDDFLYLFSFFCYIEVDRRWRPGCWSCGERTSGDSGDVTETEIQQCFQVMLR